MELIAKTFMGLEDLLVQELTELGAEDIVKGCRVVSFKGDKALMYRANFALRTAIRILKPIKTFKAKGADDVYDAVKEIDWSEYIAEGKTFTVDSVVYSDSFNNSRFVTYKVKDAIVDQFREKTGRRPSISITDPDVRLNVHIGERTDENGVKHTEGTISLDSSGESLHRRGYRQEQVDAPLNEVLAAGMIMMTGWKGETDFIDPMCGSGTLLIEAALIARNIAPGVFRQSYAFEKWPDFDRELFDEIYNDDSKETEFTHHIYGYDIDFKAVNIAKANVKAAGLMKDITIEQQNFADMQGLPNPDQYIEQNLSGERLAVIVTNPPYGERISTPNLLETYKMIGRQLKHHFKGCEAWILSYKDECFAQIGLKPSLRVPMYNGSLECEYRKYLMFDGRLEDFREEGGIVKTEDEKRKMAEKRRSWQKHDYAKMREERASNEEADILSFEFQSLKKQRPQYGDRDRKFQGSGSKFHDRDDDRRFQGSGSKFQDRDRKFHRDRDDRQFRSKDNYKSREERQADRKKFFQKRNDD